MYITIEEVILIEDKRRITDNDPIVYIRELRGIDVLTLDKEHSRFASEAKPYGRCYFDIQENMCVVPDVWREDHEYRAKAAVRCR